MTGPRYAFSAVAVTRSYSPHLGAMSTEQVTKTSGAIALTSALTRFSCAGLRKDHRKQIAIACTPSAMRARMASSASFSFNATTTSPKQSTRSETPRIRRLGTMGTGFEVSGKCTTLRISRPP